MAKPATVGVRELKTRLGGYLQRVRRGQRIIVTDRGTPVAEIRPIETTESDDAALERLIALGVVTRKVRRPPRKIRPIDVPGVSLSEAIIADRADRL
jgi:prevent-host-death family protein